MLPAVALGFGIALAAWLPPFLSWWPFAGALLTLLVWIGLLQGNRPARSAAAVALFFLLLGTFRFQGVTANRGEGELDPANRDAVVAGTVAASPGIRDGKEIFQLGDARVRNKEGTWTVKGRIEVVLRDFGEIYRTGDRLLVRGQLSVPRGDRNLAWFDRSPEPARRRIAARLYVSAPVWVRPEGRSAGGGLRSAVNGWRDEAVRFWDRRGSSAANLLKALTTGERSGMADELRLPFIRSGLAHLLAVSGLHLGFVAFFVYLFFRRSLVFIEPLVLRYPVQPIAAAATLPFIALFYLFSGGQVSTGRAAVMAGLGLVAVVVARRTDLVNLVAFAALLMLLADPLLLFSISFQLSFAAVTLLVLAAARFPRLSFSPGPPPLSRRFLHYLLILFLTSLVAAVGTTPLAAYHFQRLTFTGPAANILAVPLTGFVVLPLGLASIAGEALWPPLGELIAWPAEMAAGILLSLARLFAGFSWSSVAIPRPPPLLVASLLALTAAILFRPERKEGKGRRIVVAALAALTIVTALWWGGCLVRPGVRVHFLDVGQGDATLVLLPAGGTILVDTGPSWEHGDAGRTIVAPALRKLGVSRIDTLVLTHLHPDHSGGLLSILEEFPVGEIWAVACEGEECPQSTMDRLRRWEGEGGDLRFPLRGDVREREGGVRIEVLNPAAEPYRAGGEHQARNDNSLVFLLTWKGFRLLMTGDIGAAPARDVAALIPSGKEGGVVKVPHHGGRQEGTPLLVANFRPALAVISVGRNRYGHPNDGTVAVYEREGRVVRTDLDGGITVRSDGSSLEVRTWKELSGHRTWAERVRWLFEGW